MNAHIKCLNCPFYKSGWKLFNLYELCTKKENLQASTCKYNHEYKEKP